MATFPVRTGWLIALSVAVVVAVNTAGIWGIAVARRGAAAEEARLFEAETAARARALAGVLSDTRADLAFLAASAPLARLEEGGIDQAEAHRRRAGAEGVLLLFLRSHSEVTRLLVRSARGQPLLHTGRRGGVPVLWVSAKPTGHEGPALAPGHPRLTTSVAAPSEPAAPGIRLEMEVAPAAVLGRAQASAEPAPACVLKDARGMVLARYPDPDRPRPPAASATSAAPLTAEATVPAEGWSSPPPWTLACTRADGRTASRLDPATARYRTTLALNLGVMALALLLGGFAVQQVRRRERLEARAREETRVRELERQLFHAERLTTVGRLAAGIAHEINNPLEGMANYLSLARDALARGEVETAQHSLGSVREGMDRVAAIVRQVLAHADPAAAPRTPVDLNQVLEETRRFVASRREFSRVVFRADLAAGPLPVRGSAVMLGQVAVNLVLNACEAQPEGGEVEVRSRREGAMAMAEIADRGPGVPEADRQRIFEPFYSTKDSTGLGLSICHSIVRQHGGELTVHPREGGGAVFRIALPVSEGEA